MAVTKLNVGSRAPAVVVGVGLLLATCLVLKVTTTVASASRPLKVSASEGDGAQRTAVESPPPVVGHIIQTVAVVGGTAEQEDDRGAAAPMLMNVDMLGGIKNQGPSPGGEGH